MEVSTPLLKTKLNIPPKRPSLVHRPRLMDKLGEALQQQHPLILISAKAGSGKTTLVIEWGQQQGRPMAWLSLDINDNDPRRFLSYLVAIMQEVDSTVGPVVLSQLEFPILPPVEALAAELVNDLASRSIPISLNNT